MDVGDDALEGQTQGRREGRILLLCCSTFKGLRLDCLKESAKEHPFLRIHLLGSLENGADPAAGLRQPLSTCCVFPSVRECSQFLTLCSLQVSFPWNSK